MHELCLTSELSVCLFPLGSSGALYTYMWGLEQPSQHHLVVWVLGPLYRCCILAAQYLGACLHHADA